MRVTDARTEQRKATTSDKAKKIQDELLLNANIATSMHTATQHNDTPTHPQSAFAQLICRLVHVILEHVVGQPQNTALVLERLQHVVNHVFELAEFALGVIADLERRKTVILRKSTIDIHRVTKSTPKTTYNFVENRRQSDVAPHVT